jgi:ParB-like chromosome segregation protein Spo0J
MAVTFHSDAEVDRTANGGYTVLPENIIIKPELSGRSEETDVTELAEDILSRGQLVAAICYKSPEGWPVLIAGHRRYRAVALINKSISDPEKKIKLKFNYAQVKTEEEALDLTVAENRNRTDINPIDDCYNINVYAEKFGKGIEEIARKYFPGATTPEKLAKAFAWVKERQSLLQLSPEAQEKLRKGEFSTTAALQLAKLQPVEQDKLIEKKEKEGQKVKVKDVKAAKEESKGKSPAPRPEKPAKEIKDNTPNKRLKKFAALAELAGGLAYMIVLPPACLTKADIEDHKADVLHVAKSVALCCKQMGVPLFAGLDSWAEANRDYASDLNLDTVG